MLIEQVFSPEIGDNERALKKKRLDKLTSNVQTALGYQTTPTGYSMQETSRAFDEEGRFWDTYERSVESLPVTGDFNPLPWLMRNKQIFLRTTTKRRDLGFTHDERGYLKSNIRREEVKEYGNLAECIKRQIPDQIWQAALRGEDLSAYDVSFEMWPALIDIQINNTSRFLELVSFTDKDRQERVVSVSINQRSVQDQQPYQVLLFFDGEGKLTRAKTIYQRDISNFTILGMDDPYTSAQIDTTAEMAAQLQVPSHATSQKPAVSTRTKLLEQKAVEPYFVLDTNGIWLTAKAVEALEESDDPEYKAVARLLRANQHQDNRVCITQEEIDKHDHFGIMRLGKGKGKKE